MVRTFSLPLRLRGAAASALACALGLSLVLPLGPLGCSPDVRAGAELDGSASDGLVYVFPDLHDTDRTDLWRARLSDGAVQPFMETPNRDETWPFWSVPACTLVFAVRPVVPKGKGPQQLLLWSDGVERDLPGVSARHEAWAAWSARGSRLAYVFTRLRQPRIHNGIAVIDIEKEEQRILGRSGPKQPYIRPELDPEGVRVVAQRLVPPEKPGTQRGSQVWLLKTATSPRKLSAEDAYAMKARFTRDGRHVVLTRQADPGSPGDIVLMRADGTGARVLASTPESDDHTARASPTRDEIAFVSNRDGKHDLFLARLDGGEPRNLMRDLDFEASAPRWSPDGSRIVVTANPHDSEAPMSRERRVSRDIAHILVLDRRGRLLFKTRGFSPDWMPPWNQ